MALDRDIERLRRLPVFGCLDAEALKLVAFSAASLDLRAGQVLFRRGEAAEAAILVIAGTLALDEEHEDALSVRWAPAGTLLNEAALFAPGRQTVTATAHENCTVMSVQRNLMLKMLDVHPANAGPLRLYWANRLAGRLAAFRSAARP